MCGIKPCVRTSRCQGPTPPMPTHVCFCCRWFPLDSPNAAEMSRPLTMSEGMVSGFAVTAEEFHMGNMRRVVEILETGLHPGVTAWCGRCGRVTPLVLDRCDNAGEAIQDVLRRWEAMMLWLH